VRKLRGGREKEATKNPGGKERAVEHWIADEGTHYRGCERDQKKGEVYFPSRKERERKEKRGVDPASRPRRRRSKGKRLRARQKKREESSTIERKEGET